MRQPKINNRQSTISASTRAIAALAFAVSLLFLSYYFQQSEILLYGDAIAHINIARRVFDSRTPGLLQLGTVWLPLPHLLMIPFLLSDGMWQTGVGGSIPSMIAYVFGAVGIFRLTRGLTKGAASPLARVGPWVAALVYVANPNLIYLQTTAMTETVYLAFFVWTVVYLVEFFQYAAEKNTTTKDSKAHKGKFTPLWKCALCMFGAELTRYDGWLLAAVIATAIAGLAIQQWRDRPLRWAALKFFLAIAAAPALWLTYNAAVYGNPLEFANGPYSAKAITERAATPRMPSYPGAGNVVVAASYFLKSAELNMASGNWGRIWIAIAVAGLILTFIQLRCYWPLLVLWVPVVFYALSIAYGGVPLFVPAWWPFTLYNVRYGIQLLPLFAASAGLIVTYLGESSAPEEAGDVKGAAAVQPRAKFAIAAVCVTGVIVVLSYVSIWKAQPACLREASVNSRTKLALESAVARSIRGLPHTANYLMYLGDHVGVFQQAGIPLRQVINEGNHRPWKRPSDPEGLWERALADPANYVDLVIAFDNDPVARAVNNKGLTLLTVIHTTGQPEARIYLSRSKSLAE